MAQGRQSFWFLENIDLTNVFCPKKMGETVKHLEHKTFERNSYIYLPQADANKVYFILEGRVKIGTYTQSDPPQEVTKSIIGPGEVFGELAVAGQSKQRDFAYAMERTTVCLMDASNMTSLVKDHMPINLFMMKLFAKKSLELEKRLESLMFKDSRTRILEFLSDLADSKGERVGYEWVVRKFYTHQDIANLTATSRQTVTTILNELKAKNIITYNRRRLLIRDLDKLKSCITDTCE